jgi:hypothetical protein
MAARPVPAAAEAPQPLPAAWAHVTRLQRFLYHGRTVRLEPGRPVFMDAEMRAAAVDAGLFGVEWKDSR